MLIRSIKAEVIAVLISAALVSAAPLSAQYAPPRPPLAAPSQLDNLVSQVALYPDPLLAQVLAAATFPDQIPEAAQWADQHSYQTGDALARSIADDNLPWDPAIQALLPFPTVLDTMARDLNWTSQLGNAFLAQRADVMDAVQRMRQRAWDYGYLRSNQYVQVIPSGRIIEIEPANPGYIYVPYYSPGALFVPRRPGIGIGGGITFGRGVTLGLGYRPWGWSPGVTRFQWPSHSVIIDRNPWNRSWANRREYSHNYSVPRTYSPAPRVERHELRRGEHADRPMERREREGERERRR